MFNTTKVFLQREIRTYLVMKKTLREETFLLEEHAASAAMDVLELLEHAGLIKIKKSRRAKMSGAGTSWVLYEQSAKQRLVEKVQKGFDKTAAARRARLQLQKRGLKMKSKPKKKEIEEVEW